MPEERDAQRKKAQGKEMSKGRFEMRRTWQVTGASRGCFFHAQGVLHTSFRHALFWPYKIL
jgi:hypothetical protein